MLSNEEADILVNNQVLMPDFHVYEVGFEHCRPTKPVEYVPIDYWVLHYCVSGEGYFSLTGTTEKHIQSGDLFMIPAHFGNRYYPKASKSMDLSLDWVIWTGCSKFISTLSVIGEAICHSRTLR